MKRCGASNSPPTKPMSLKPPFHKGTGGFGVLGGSGDWMANDNEVIINLSENLYTMAWSFR